ncbi:glycoside hydrolase family 61 protein [Chaetomium strumarium]|uniref:lytic cellulose monooxygenase (C4-dehydrogenating) n=1 Tax=Chaetomium strumarium TaxID=1170767 RepID=A0AAJ0GX98_9PEZI|nr:glycoside hydrolase family 61 protein [Chaetomium strumarium]
MVPHATLSAALVSALATTALGHGMVTSFKTDGTLHQGFILDYYYAKVNKQPVPDIAAWYAENLDSGFVAPNAYQTPDINCHKNASPGTLTASVAAGGTVTFNWPATWPHPHGPILTYVAKCTGGDCTKADKNSLRWVKIHEADIDLATQKWASQDLIDRGGVWSVTVPRSIAPGDYVFRHEIIALHGAGSLNGAQNYPQCFNIRITGAGTKSPSGVLGTQLYKNTDPGIYFNPYTTIKNYTIPGPSMPAW